jgi:hypothetical protein
MSMFEQAARLKLRFDSPKGALTVEDLWDIPLTSGTGKANLDDVAKGLYTQLREAGATVSFVVPAESKADALQLKFDVAKHIIDVRLAERNAEAEASKRRETKSKILEIIARKQDTALEGKSLEELTAMAQSL